MSFDSRMTTQESRIRKIQSRVAILFIIVNKMMTTATIISQTQILFLFLSMFYTQFIKSFVTNIMTANVGSYTQVRIAGDFLSSRKTARAERYPPKTTAAALDG
jgi:uncharacterized membrane protein